MKDADGNMGAILRRIRERGCVLMLDFDGVLSPIAQVPSDARISRNARSALEICAEKMPVAIITGRTLSDIKKRVGLNDLIYAGSHGMEWDIDGRVHRRNASRSALAVFAAARRALLKYSKNFPALYIEDKKHCLALGYRALFKKRTDQFRQGAKKIISMVTQAQSVRVIDNLYTFELMPASEWTKGECARNIFKMVAKKRSIGVYIGDTLTDEDAFRIFAKTGITIRIGKSRTSSAQFYFKSRSSVDVFLTRIAHQK